MLKKIFIVALGGGRDKINNLVNILKKVQNNSLIIYSEEDDDSIQKAKFLSDELLLEKMPVNFLSSIENMNVISNKAIKFINTIEEEILIVVASRNFVKIFPVHFGDKVLKVKFQYISVTPGQCVEVDCEKKSQEKIIN